MSRRILLKLSGEALAGPNKTGFDEATVRDVGRQIKMACEEGLQVAIVIGGGNFWRGRSSDAINRVKADQIGMLATVMNCLYVSSLFNSMGMETEVFCAFEVGGIVKLFDYDAVEAALNANKVVFFAGGTGHPYFSTDTGVAVRAVEMKMDEILLAKAIDGVYSADPKLDPNAVKYDTIPIDEVVAKKLGVIDLAAAILCMENKVPMAVFGLAGEDSIYNAIKGNITGTRITV